jgi:hypothetical protein
VPGHPKLTIQDASAVFSLNPSLNSNEPRATRRSFFSDVGTVYVFLAAEHKYNCTTLSPHPTALLSAYSHTVVPSALFAKM